MQRSYFAFALVALMVSWPVPGFADDKPKKEPTKLTIAANKTPFQKDVKFAEGDCCIVVLPNKKKVALWAEKDRFPFGEQQTKSGLQCLWGEKPFQSEQPKDSYINDLSSEPALKVKVVVKKLEDKKDK